MTSYRVLVLALLFGLPCMASGQIVPPVAGYAGTTMSSPADKRRDEVIDLLYFSPSRPVVIRLHVWVDGKPYRQMLDGFLGRAFRHFDRNGDGTLDKAEVARMPNADYFGQFINYGFNYGDPNVKMAKLEEVDTSKDGKVTPAELADYMRKNVLMTQLSASTGNNSQMLTDSLYKSLDTNKDGKLSREEWLDAPVRLRKFDEDDDEVISSQELTPTQNGGYGFAPVLYSSPSQPAVPEAPGAMLLDADSSKKLGSTLLQRFDKDRSKTLSGTEFPVEKATFDSLDADGDGQLDTEELARWGKRGPDLELTCRLNGINPKASLLTRALKDLAKSIRPAPALEVMKRDKPAPLTDAVTKSENGMLKLTLRDAFLDLSGRSVSDQDFSSGVRAFFRDQFRNADADKTGYLDPKEAKSPSGQFFQALHALADRDGDAQLTLKELDALLDLAVEAPTCTLRINLNDQGRALFPLIDSGSDNVLSLREWRTAQERLKAWDHNGDGMLAKDEVPRYIDLSVTQGQSNLPSNGVVSSFSFAIPRLTPPAKEPETPEWFRKMDRNGDGDVSVREFLGNEEDFVRIDTDGDGLIGANEATKAKVR